MGTKGTKLKTARQPDLEKLESLAQEVLATPEDQFDMSEHATCLIGVAARVWPKSMGIDPCSTDFAETFGIEPEQARALCILCPGSKRYLQYVTRRQAVTAIRKFIKTGKVRYSP